MNKFSNQADKVRPTAAKGDHSLRDGFRNLKREAVETWSNLAKLAATLLYVFCCLTVVCVPSNMLRMREKADIALTLLAAFAAAWTAIGAVLAGQELKEIKRIANGKELAGAPNHVEGLRRMREGQARLAQAMLTASNYCAKGTLAAMCVAVLTAGKIASVSLWDTAREHREETVASQRGHEPEKSAAIAASEPELSTKR